MFASPDPEAKAGGCADAAFAHADDALAAMRRWAIRPTPRHYGIWYEYQSGGIPDLRRTIEGILSSGRTVDQHMMDELHARYFGPQAGFTALRETSRRVQDTLREMFGLVSEAGADATRYGTTLRDVSGQVAADPRTLPAAVARLMTEMREMSRRSDELGRHLRQSAEQITELERRLEDARQEALTDPLTGLPNRRGFDMRLRQEAGAAMDSGDPLSLLVVDIDRFKAVNDTWGHAVGDAVLRLVGATLSRSVRATDHVARHGGEEFAVLLPGTPLAGALRCAETVRAAVGKQAFTIRATGKTIGTITVSVGASRYRPGESLAGWVRRADDALYRAKRGGRNRVECEPTG